MKNRLFSIAAAATLATLAACGGKKEGAETQQTDTTTVPSADTVMTPTPVPTQDTVVTQTTTESDTIKGQAPDTAAPAADTMKK
jgi:predicted small lipoprotein YifL